MRSRFRPAVRRLGLHPRGNDRLTGGVSADTFSGGQGTDTATDFAPAEGDTTDTTVP